MLQENVAVFLYRTDNRHQRYFFISDNDLDSDVGDIVILVTLWRWRIWDVGGRILCCYVGDFLNLFEIYGHQHLKLVTNIRHQHRCNLNSIFV